MAVRPSHRPHRDRSPCITLKMAQAEPLWGRPHQNHEGPLSPHDLVWSPCGFSVPSAACRKEQRNNLRCKVCHMLCGTKLFLEHCGGNSCALVPLFHWKLLFPIFSYSMCLKRVCCSVALCENRSGLLWRFAPPPRICM